MVACYDRNDFDKIRAEAAAVTKAYEERHSAMDELRMRAIVSAPDPEGNRRQRRAAQAKARRR